MDDPCTVQSNMSLIVLTVVFSLWWVIITNSQYSFINNDLFMFILVDEI